jgi:hypothetical protein
VTAAVACGNIPALRTLLEHGASPKQADSLGNTSLSIAAALGLCDAVRLLIQFGANPNVSSGAHHELPLQIAVHLWYVSIQEAGHRHGLGVSGLFPSLEGGEGAIDSAEPRPEGEHLQVDSSVGQSRSEMPRRDTEVQEVGEGLGAALDSAERKRDGGATDAASCGARFPSGLESESPGSSSDSETPLRERHVFKPRGTTVPPPPASPRDSSPIDITRHGTECSVDALLAPQLRCEMSGLDGNALCGMTTSSATTEGIHAIDVGRWSGGLSCWRRCGSGERQGRSICCQLQSGVCGRWPLGGYIGGGDSGEGSALVGKEAKSSGGETGSMLAMAGRRCEHGCGIAHHASLFSWLACWGGGKPAKAATRSSMRLTSGTTPYFSIPVFHCNACLWCCGGGFVRSQAPTLGRRSFHACKLRLILHCLSPPLSRLRSRCRHPPSRDVFRLTGHELGVQACQRGAFALGNRLLFCACAGALSQQLQYCKCRLWRGHRGNSRAVPPHIHVCCLF